MPNITDLITPTLATTDADKLLIVDIEDIKFPQQFEDAYSGWSRAVAEQSKTPWGRKIEFPGPPRTNSGWEGDSTIRSPEAAATQEAAIETYDELQTLRDKWQAEISDLTGEIPLELPPLRAVNHTIPLIDESKKYIGHRPRCPQAYQKTLQEKIEKYVTAGWWEFMPVDNALPMLCLPKDTTRLRTVIDLRERNNNTVHDVTVTQKT
jgi:hypothetical protein